MSTIVKRTSEGLVIIDVTRHEAVTTTYRPIKNPGHQVLQTTITREHLCKIRHAGGQWYAYNGAQTSAPKPTPAAAAADYYGRHHA